MAAKLGDYVITEAGFGADLSARIVATITTASGLMPAARALISKNFSAPKSAPNPASVIT
ncbi:hypothetical protein ACUN90_16610 [Escherichia sp. SP-MK2]